MSRKESITLYICIFFSLFGGIFLFHLLSWVKPQLFFTNHYRFFSSGEYSFVWMIGIIALLMIGTLSWFSRRKQVSSVCAMILLLLSFTYITSYKGVTNQGFESHYLLVFQENIEWKQIKQIDTDYRVDETKGVFYPTFMLEYANDQERLDDWGNPVTSKPDFSDMTSSGWVNDDEDLHSLGLLEVKLMTYVYQHAPAKLHCVQRGFLSSKPKKQVEAWNLFAKHFVDKPNCLFESE